MPRLEIADEVVMVVEIPVVADRTLSAISDPIPGTLPSEQQQVQTCTDADLSCLTYAERKKKISRDKRSALYEEVMALYREGLGQRAMHVIFISAGTPYSIMSPHLPSRIVQKVLHDAHRRRTSSIRICLISVSNGMRVFTTILGSLLRSKSAAILAANHC